MVQQPGMPKAVESFFISVNKSEPEAFISAFETDAIIMDLGREIKGIAAIKKWSDKDIFEPKVCFEVIDIDKKNDTIIVTAKVDGHFDKTNLPDPLLLKHEFKWNRDKIKELMIKL